MGEYILHGDKEIAYKEYDVVTKDGFRLLVLFYRTGHRCGYVGIPKDCSSENIDSDKLDVHGGITFEGPYQQIDDRYYFGFDCLHDNDAHDVENLKKYFPDTKDEYIDFLKMYPNEVHIWTKEEVVEETLKLYEGIKRQLKDKK